MQMIAWKAQRAPGDPREHPSSQPNEDAGGSDGVGGILRARHLKREPVSPVAEMALTSTNTRDVFACSEQIPETPPGKRFPTIPQEKVSDPLC